MTDDRLATAIATHHAEHPPARHVRALGLSGELAVAEALDRTARRVVLVTDTDESTRTLRIILATNRTETATDLDVILSRGTRLLGPRSISSSRASCTVRFFRSSLTTPSGPRRVTSRRRSRPGFRQMVSHSEASPSGFPSPGRVTQGAPSRSPNLRTSWSLVSVLPALAVRRAIGDDHPRPRGASASSRRHPS